MKEDSISQLGDYDAPFCEQHYTHGSCFISLFKFKSFDQFKTPQTALKFRHLLSYDTIVMFVRFILQAIVLYASSSFCSKLIVFYVCIF